MERSAIGEDKALHYLYSGILPSRLANRLQTMKMCEAFGKKVKTILYFRHALATKEEIREYYNVEPTFDMEILGYSKLPRLRSLFLVLKFLRLLRSKKLEGVIYVREIPLAFWLLTFRKLRFFKLPVSLELHGWFDGGVMRRIAQYVVHNAINIVVITNFLKHEVESFTCIKKILVAPDGVDLERFKDIPQQVARTQLNIPLKDKVICYTGHLFAWKGVHTLVSSTKHLPNGYRLYVVGGKDPDIQALKGFIDVENLSNVVLIGYVTPDLVPMYLAAANVVVLPGSAKEKISRHYTSPLKLFEYMASRRPIVASNLPSIREVLRDGKNAVLVEPDNPKALAKGIRRVLEDPDLAGRISEQAYSEVGQYSWDERARRIIELLKI
ncbi:MAG: glycosyltransferase family 4 protein [Candidatus Ranarchaeia archaeon]